MSLHLHNDIPWGWDTSRNVRFIHVSYTPYQHGMKVILRSIFLTPVFWLWPASHEAKCGIFCLWHQVAEWRLQGWQRWAGQDVQPPACLLRTVLLLSIANPLSIGSYQLLIHSAFFFKLARCYLLLVAQNLWQYKGAELAWPRLTGHKADWIHAAYCPRDVALCSSVGVVPECNTKMWQMVIYEKPVAKSTGWEFSFWFFAE